VYYNGGESVEETAYMLSAHEALLDMATHAGDDEAAERHHAIAQKIRSNFFVDGVGLWLNASGHPAAWREEVGHKRLRPDPWSYSIFLPIDTKLLTGLEAAQALHYTEWGLQRLHMTCDDGAPCGQRHWTSNWVPSVWSAREFWPVSLAQSWPSSGWAQRCTAHRETTTPWLWPTFRQAFPTGAGTFCRGTFTTICSTTCRRELWAAVSPAALFPAVRLLNRSGLRRQWWS